MSGAPVLRLRASGAIWSGEAGRATDAWAYSQASARAVPQDAVDEFRAGQPDGASLVHMNAGILITVVDVALIVHAAKTGRFSPWGFIILFLPGVGALAYVVVELVPEWFGSYGARRARQQFAGAINPAGRYRQLHDELEVVDTIANRSALASECLTLGKYDEALGLYDAILAKPLGEEPGFMLGKARAEYGLGDAGAALATLDDRKRRWPDYQSADGHLLYAMALEKAGREAEALVNYAAVGEYFPGVEPEVRQAQLLQKLGRGEEARALADDVVRTLGRAPAHVQKSQRQWLASAQKLARS